MSNRFFWGVAGGLLLVLTALVLMAAASPAGRAAFQVPRITCGACSNTISQGLETCAGVAGVQVDVPTRTVRVAYDPDATDPGEIAQALGRLGYPGRLVAVGAAATASAAAGNSGCGCCDKPNPQ